MKCLNFLFLLLRNRVKAEDVYAKSLTDGGHENTVWEGFGSEGLTCALKTVLERSIDGPVYWDINWNSLWTTSKPFWNYYERQSQDSTSWRWAKSQVWLVGVRAWEHELTVKNQGFFFRWTPPWKYIYRISLDLMYINLPLYVRVFEGLPSLEL